MNQSLKENNFFLKNVFDYSIALLSIVLVLPIIPILILLITISGKGPCIYSQIRIGKGGIPFRIYKFRSMQSGTENGLPLITGKDDNRITYIGRIMRKHKLDEIPNFINVLKGDMSLVGPRPEQQYFVDLILEKAPDYKFIQNIKPGITSWGQVKYGYAKDVDQIIDRLKYDLYYLKNRSIWFDLKVIYYTLGIIIKGKGI